jgi:prolyl 4-hydroxylase
VGSEVIAAATPAVVAKDFSPTQRAAAEAIADKLLAEVLQGPQSDVITTGSQSVAPSAIGEAGVPVIAPPNHHHSSGAEKQLPAAGIRWSSPRAEVKARVAAASEPKAFSAYQNRKARATTALPSQVLKPQGAVSIQANRSSAAASKVGHFASGMSPPRLQLAGSARRSADRSVDEALADVTSRHSELPSRPESVPQLPLPHHYRTKQDKVLRKMSAGDRSRHLLDQGHKNRSSLPGRLMPSDLTALEPKKAKVACNGKEEDSHDDCPFWTKNGDCASNPDYMLRNCAKSCCAEQALEDSQVACNGKEEDSHDDCPFWTKNGDCASNPDYMLRNCAKSCCAEQATTSATTSTTIATSTTFILGKAEVIATTSATAISATTTAASSATTTATTLAKAEVIATISATTSEVPQPLLRQTPNTTGAPTESENCECHETWDFQGKTYKGCNLAGYNFTWCYLLASASCSRARESDFAGETRKWKMCENCDCHKTWDFKGTTYRDCDVTPQYDFSWCYLQMSGQCPIAIVSDFAGESRKWKYCGVNSSLNIGPGSYGEPQGYGEHMWARGDHIILPNGSNQANLGRAAVIAVVHHDAENVAWVKQLVAGGNGYGLFLSSNKAENGDLRFEGSVAAIYVNWILDHYDTLPERTAFMHTYGGAYPGIDEDYIGQKRNFGPDILGFLDVNAYSYSGLTDTWTVYTSTEGHVTGSHDFFETVVQDTTLLADYPRDPWGFYYPCCSSFLVSKERIMRYDKPTWQRILDWIFLNPYQDVLERSWHILFGEHPHMELQNTSLLCPLNPNFCRKTTQMNRPFLFTQQEKRLQWYFQHSNREIHAIAPDPLDERQIAGLRERRLSLIPLPADCCVGATVIPGSPGGSGAVIIIQVLNGMDYRWAADVPYEMHLLSIDNATGDQGNVTMPQKPQTAEPELTFVRYIIDNYENLPPRMAFFPRRQVLSIYGHCLDRSALGHTILRVCWLDQLVVAFRGKAGHGGRGRFFSLGTFRDARGGV